MKITNVIAHQLVVAVDEPFTSARGPYYKQKGALVVEVVTDEGIVGWRFRCCCRGRDLPDRKRTAMG